MSFLQQVNQERTGVAAAAVVFIICAIVSCIVWYPLSLPGRGINAILPDVSCSSITPGTFLMYLCSAGIALLMMAGPVLLIALIFLVRKPLTRWVQRLTPKLPPEAHFLVAPVLSTIFFVIVWAGLHYAMTSQVGLLPQIIFPAVIGLFTFAVARYSPSLQHVLDPFFSFRDKYPRWLRLVIAIAVPMLIAVVITYQDRVTQAPQKEQFIVLVTIIMVYLAIAPRSATLMSPVQHDNVAVSPQVTGQTGGLHRMNLDERSIVLSRVGLSVGMAALLGLLANFLHDLSFISVAFAHDCDPVANPTDCQATAGHNVATSIGSGAAGAAANDLGTSIAGSGQGTIKDESITPSGAIISDANLQGGPWDNPYTHFHGGEGPGICDPPGLPNYWVNTATLNLVVQDNILTYDGLGPAIALTLTYNASNRKPGIFGNGWSFSHESTIEQTDQHILVWKGSGQSLRFNAGPHLDRPSTTNPLEFVCLQGGFDRLLDYGTYWLFIEKGTRFLYRYNKQPGTNVSRLTAISDFNGNTVQIQYSADGVIQNITDAAGRSTNLSYNHGNKQCVSFTLPDGRTAMFSYDNQGNLVQVQDLLGIPSIYEYDTDQHMTRLIVGRDGRTTIFTYQGIGQGKAISTVTDAVGNTTYYKFISGNPQQVQVIDPEGKVTTFYSDQGRTEKIVDPLGYAVRYGYINGTRVSVEDKNGQISQMEYDRRGNMTRFIDRLGNSLSWAYDNYDYLISETSPIGEVITYEYDERHNLIKVTTPLGGVVVIECDSKGQVVAITDANGNKSTAAYDRYGNLAEISDPLGNKTCFDYDQYGLNVTSITDARGNITRYEHDQNNRLTKVTHSDGSTRVHIYDCCSRIATSNENGHETTFSRDPLIRIRERADGMGSTKNLEYDAQGRLVNLMDALGHSTKFFYDDVGRLSHKTNQRGDTVKLDYDKAGNIISICDERGKQTTFNYDANSLKTRVADPLNCAVSYTRDALGRISFVRNARNHRIAFSYDAYGRITNKAYDGVIIAVYKYDSAGNLIEVTDNSGTLRYQYDAANQVIAIQYPNDFQVLFSYNEMGDVSRIEYPGDLIVEYTYDTRNRVNRIMWGNNSISYRYDSVGNVVCESRSNGVESIYTYDRVNKFVEIKHQKGNNNFIHMTYNRDAVGNIISESGIMPLETTPNESDVSIEYNDSNQIMSRELDRYTYDADGNLTDISGGKWHAVYDAENRPIEIYRNSQSSKYIYDGMGHRIKVEAGSQTRIYYHNHYDRILFETDESGNIVAYYIYDSLFLVSRVDNLNNVHFYHFDKTGSILALTDGDGKVATSYAYDPFGTVVGKMGDIDNPFTYVGVFGVMDEGDGLFFMKNRYYDALSGRFIHKDPIGIVGDTNLYTYVENNPISGIDPFGLENHDLSSTYKHYKAPSNPSPPPPSSGPTVLGPTTGIVNLGIGVFLIARAYAAVQTGGASEFTVWSLISVTASVARIISVVKRASHYTKPGYDGTDAILDIIDSPETLRKVHKEVRSFVKTQERRLEWAERRVWDPNFPDYDYPEDPADWAERALLDPNFPSEYCDPP